MVKKALWGDSQTGQECTIGVLAFQACGFFARRDPSMSVDKYR